jgi:hypothetical protein
MADSITIAGKKFPRAVVYGGGLAVVGIVGYAYLTRSPSTGDDIEAEVLVPEEPTGTLPFGGTQSGIFTEGPVAYRNDQEWFSDALDKLIYNYGVADTATASDALNRYLTNKALTAAQVPMINYVINSIGPPPSGPRTVKQETTPGGGVKPPPSAPPPVGATPARPTGLKVEGSNTSDITWVWNPVPGAGTYRIDLIQGTNDVIHSTRIGASSRPRWRARSSYPRALPANRPFRIVVWALNNQNKAGPSATTTGRTKR